MSVAAVIGGAIAIVAALRTAWETDWNGIRTTLTRIWNNNVKPALQALWQWLGTNIPIAIQTIADFWEDTLRPALAALVEFIKDDVVPVVETVVEWLGENVPKAMKAIREFWLEKLKPALQNLIEFIGDVNDAVRAMRDWFAEKLLKGLSKALDFIRDVIDAFNKLIDAVKGVIEWVRKLLDLLSKVKVPGPLKQHSLPPLAQGILDTAMAAAALNENLSPTVNMIQKMRGWGGTLTGLQAPAAVVRAARATTYYDYRSYQDAYNLHAHSTLRPGGMRMEFDAMRALGTR